MSSEEDTDCFGLYGDKSLKKTKRTRQRVDAGEPRNSYSSIPNFSSRPSFMSGGLYGAIFSQSQQHFGLFGPNGFGSAKMLNEFLGRQVKQAQDATAPDNMTISTMEAANNSESNSIHGFDNVSLSNSNKRRASSGLDNLMAVDQSTGPGSDRSSGGSTPPKSKDLTHHMLRNILERNKEVINNLDQELRITVNHNSISAGGGVGVIGGEGSSPDNNNSISKNNNNTNSSNNINLNNNTIKVKSEIINFENSGAIGGGHLTNAGCGDVSDSSDTGNVSNTNLVNSSNINNINNSKNNDDNLRQVLNSSVDSNRSETSHNSLSAGLGVNLLSGTNGIMINTPTPQERALHERELINKKEHDELLDDELMGLNSGRNSVNSITSINSDDISLVRPKEELDLDLTSDKDGSSPIPGQKQSEPVALDMKRARVENIVSGMRSSPALTTTPQVNGCKKRKLYHPQQHDNSAAERYASVGLNIGLNIQNMMLDDEDADDEIETPQIHQKRVEKDALKSQLRSMQEQLAEMQQKYVQLCTRMEQESETQEDPSSDLDQDDNNESVSDTQPQLVPQRSPTPPPVTKEMPTKQPTNQPNLLSQVMNKMMTAKIHGQMSHHPHLPPNFNGAHPFLQHMQQHSGQMGPHDHPMQHMHPQHPHQAISNAAAMYLNVSQKFLMEQEGMRMAKEAAEQQTQQQQQQQQKLDQQNRKTSPIVQQQQQHQNQLPKSSPSIPSDLTERLNIMRTNASLAPLTGSDLEGLAEVLKSEITASLSNLVDSIVTRFVHQRRFLGKQSEAAAVAAAEQLNKDLLMASQLLERKSPRIKITERSVGHDNNRNVNRDQSREASSSSDVRGGNNINMKSNNNTNNNMNSTQSGNGPISINNNQPSHNILNHTTAQQNSGSVAPRMNGNAFPPMGGLAMHMNGPQLENSPNLINPINIPPHMHNSPTAAMFQSPKTPSSLNSVAAAALLGRLSHGTGPVNHFFKPNDQRETPTNEQNEALSLVVTPKKKRHKVTDTRITPRTVSRILAQDGIGPPSQSQLESNHQNNPAKQYGNPPVSVASSTPNATPSPRPQYHPPPQPQSMMPVSLPTSVAIPNPSLHESQVFSPYSPFFNPHAPHGPHGPQPTQLHHMKMSSSPPGLGGMMDPRDSPPLPHPPTMLHPALLAAAHHGSSPDYGHIRSMENNDRNSDCNSAEMGFDGQATISFFNDQKFNM